MNDIMNVHENLKCLLNGWAPYNYFAQITVGWKANGLKIVFFYQINADKK